MVIVQIGTNTASWISDGQIHFDSCLQYVAGNPTLVEFVHLIEPISDCNPHIEDSYKFFSKKKIYNIAITDDPEQTDIEIYTPSTHTTSGHSSANLEHLHRHGHTSMKSNKVECYTLNNFLQKNNITKCDRLYIDTEGLDCLILLGYDWDQFQTNYIEFEVAHSDGPFTKAVNADNCISRLKSCGFTITNNPHEPLNLIAIR